MPKTHIAPACKASKTVPWQSGIAKFSAARPDGDEMLLDVTSATSHSDSGVVSVAPNLLYEILPADNCGATVFP